MAENTQMPEPDRQDTIFNEEEFLNTGYDKPVRQARNTLFVVAAIQFIFGLITMYPIEDVAVKWVTFSIVVFISGIFVGLALWTKKKPYTAILTGLIIYCLLLLVDLFYQPSSIIKGLIMKIIVIVYLVKGLSNAKETQQLQKAFGKE
jgi:hypothetical protein